MDRSLQEETESLQDQDLPILYSFRRCPYAMRARIALTVSGQHYFHREILLRDKPAEMIVASPKATVPVLRLTDGTVLEESLDIMLWALHRHDPLDWLDPQSGSLDEMMSLIFDNDGSFKHHLDRYKYAIRYDDATDPLHHREQGMIFLNALNQRLGKTRYLAADRPALADYAVFPFVRQFANTDKDWFDAQPVSHLHTWLGDHLNSDLFNHVMKKYPVWSPGEPDVTPTPN